MSAPNTNIETQQRRHRPVLGGIGFALVFAAVLLLGYFAWLFIQTDGPEGAATQIEPVIGADDNG